jgi:adenine deaminase
MGRSKADLIVKDVTMLDVVTEELLDRKDIVIKNGRICLVGDARHVRCDPANILWTNRKIAVPGFLDGHVHVESSMLTVTEFAKAVLPRGTTGIVIDPHEIANVLGLKGIRLLHDEGLRVPIGVYLSVPSCVPAVSSRFETSGAKIGLKDIIWAFRNLERAVALGEVMNYKGVISADKTFLREISDSIVEVLGEQPG